MIFTLYYMYATLIQWWRLSSLRNKLAGTLCTESALIVCQKTHITEGKDRSCIENLLFHDNDRLGYTVVPKRTLSLKNYIQLPDTLKYFPIHVYESEMVYESPIVHLLLVADLNRFSYGTGADSIQVETLGYPLGWNAENNLSIIVKSDLNGLTKLVSSFSKRPVIINYGLELLKVETINVEDHPLSINYENALKREKKLKTTVAPKQWNTFVTMVRGLSSKINSAAPPKIAAIKKNAETAKAKPTVDSGACGSSKTKHDDSSRKVPVSEVKPIKKELKVEYGRHLDPVKRGHRSAEKDASKGEHKKRSKTPSVAAAKEEGSTIRTIDGSGIKIEVEEPQVERMPEPEAHASSSAERNGAIPKRKTEERRKETDSSLISNGLAVKPIENAPKKDSKNTKKLGIKSKSAEEPRSKHKEDSQEVKPLESLNDVKHQSKGKESKKAKADSKDLKIASKSTKASKDSKHSKERDAVKAKTAEEPKKEEELTIKKKESGTKEDLKPMQTEKNVKEDLKLELTEKKNPTGTTAKEDLKLSLTEKKDVTKSVTDKEAVPTTSGIKTVPKKAEMREITDIKKDKLSILVKRRSLKLMKPPNVLIYADSLNAKENVKRVLQSVLNKDKYTVYDLPVTGSLSGSTPTSPILWMESATLLVVCGSVSPNLIPQFLQYLVTGGQLLCLCSDLLYSILHTFTTAEVREHELVRFSYGDWCQIRMMHHIFCYQASPAKKQFSKDSESGSQSHSNGSSPIAPRTPNTVEIQHNNKTYTIQVQVLGSEETWQTPSLLLAIVKSTQGKAIFSQVHLEIDPTQYEYDENTFNALKDSNQARLEILKHLLSTHLGIDCGNSLTDVDLSYTPGYFLGRHESKQEMLTNNENIVDGVLQGDKVSAHFYGKSVEVPNATSSILPVFIHSCPSNFSTVQYFESLNTESIGRLAVYTDVLTSTQHLLGKKLTHGLVVLARQQTQGAGRGGNAWLSPQGCAMFSIQLHIPIESELGKYIPLVQHLVMVAVISAVRSQPGYEHIEIGIKWPNDLYAGGKVKIGGLITSTVLESNEAVCNVGTGINLSNSSPTTCINTLIDQYNQLNKTQLPTLSYEKFLALVFNEIENILNKVQRGNVQHLFDLYYKYWLHGDAEITVFTKEGASRRVKVTGIDEYGFLTVKAADGTVSSVQPDGNTFDMYQGLIAPKLN